MHNMDTLYVYVCVLYVLYVMYVCFVKCLMSVLHLKLPECM